MRSHSLGTGVLIAVAMAFGTSACGGIPEMTEETVGTGTVSLPLTAQTDGASYRLAKARFTIRGAGINRVITPLVNVPVHQETLPAGRYEIQLESGWVLERRGSGELSFKEVPAELSSKNPQRFDVRRNATVQGRVNVRGSSTVTR